MTRRCCRMRGKKKRKVKRRKKERKRHGRDIQKEKDRIMRGKKEIKVKE